MLLLARCILHEVVVKEKRAQVLNIHERKVEGRVVVKRLQICKQCKSNTVFKTTHFPIMEPNLYGFLLSHVVHSISI